MNEACQRYLEDPEANAEHLRDCAECRAVFDALGLEQVSLVGNSLGGRMALDMAERHPDRVKRMVLMGSPGVGMAVTDGLKALRAYEPSPENMRALLLNYFAVDKSIITDELSKLLA